ncbi:hypothetical protein AYJ54_13615 [Bradyrhizobium centrolobii]|uniref:Uncharacterized protein n=2 Tax=Bradyrhizobium centrolobii TaxID=1505087 RepID=A0A176YQF5_9BRAD|nr:hypothetical protein AYJ54_13615 [Bradyrhizobium centrolobii]
MVMTKEAGSNDDIGGATGAFQDFAKRAIVTQTEFSKRLFDTYWHWQERIQIESAQAMELFGKVTSASSATHRISIFQGWINDATLRVARDVIYSIETAKSLTNVELPPYASPWLTPLASFNLPAGAGVNFHYGSWQLPTLRIEAGRPER